MIWEVIPAFKGTPPAPFITILLLSVVFKEELCNREREEGQSSSNQSGSYEAARPKSGQEKRECEEILSARDRP